MAYAKPAEFAVKCAEFMVTFALKINRLFYYG